MDFHHNLWKAWLDGSLNWEQVDIDETDVPGISDDVLERWDEKQEWPLYDKNQFYYPLFGLGNLNSPIAFIGLGPAHNTSWIWGEGFNNDGKKRGRIFGPEINRSAWSEINGWEISPKNDENETDSDSHPILYQEGFEYQKCVWENVRIDAQNDLVRNLSDLLGEVVDNSDDDIDKIKNPFDYVYFTNFLKDGEFDANQDESDLDQSLFEDLEIISDEYKDVNDLLQNLNDLNEGTLDNLKFADQKSGLIQKQRWSQTNKTKITQKKKVRKVLELAAREFWLPFLAKELAELPNIEIVVPMGYASVEAVFHLYEFSDADAPTPPLDEVKKVLDGDNNPCPRLWETTGEQPDVLPSYHWSEQSSEFSAEKLSEEISNKVQTRIKQNRRNR